MLFFLNYLAEWYFSSAYYKSYTPVSIVTIIIIIIIIIINL